MWNTHEKEIFLSHMIKLQKSAECLVQVLTFLKLSSNKETVWYLLYFEHSIICILFLSQKRIRLDSYIGLIGTDRKCQMNTSSIMCRSSQGRTFWILSFIFNCWLANVMGDISRQFLKRLKNEKSLQPREMRCTSKKEVI